MRKTVAFALAALLALFATGCNNLEGISQEMYQSLLAETDELSAKNDALYNQIDKLKDELAVLQEVIEDYQGFNAGSIVNSFKDHIKTVGQVEIYTALTDPNQALGSPGKYTSKADFEDIRLTQSDEFLPGGSVEVFYNEETCQKRYEHLQTIDRNQVAALNQIIYHYRLVLLRIDTSLTQREMDEYITVLNEFLNETPQDIYTPDYE